MTTTYYQNRHDKSGLAAQKGRDGVDNFLDQLSKYGWEHTPASKYEDTRKHIDIHISKGEDERHVDIKAHKSWFKDGQLAIGWLLLEHTNVDGNPGWLRGGNTHVAFEQKQGQKIGFIVAKRDELHGLWDQKVDMKELADRSVDAKEIIYTRAKWNRYDIISWVKVDDVLALPGTEFWEKK